MCGIVGIASRATPVDPDRLLAMRDLMAHRGPDDAGLWRAPDGRVGLAQCRLAVIDLSPGGHQPMADGAGDCHLVFNGEIYNHAALREELQGLGHRFRSSSDTEVLLEAYRAWGADCVARLDGMFAFVIFDRRHGRLLAARDRAGEKPLFYRQAGGRLAFASELKALLADPAVPRRVDRSALDMYLAYGYVPHDRCLIEGIRKLPGGHLLEYHVDTDALRTRAYWALPAPAADAGDDEALLDELERLLEASVRSRLVADVPVGVLLSGGIDSSLVTAMAARAHPRVRTFTVSFPGHAAYDEAPFARQVAEHFGTDHAVLVAEPASLDLLPRLARQFDEPLADSSMVPTYLISRLIRREATVALGGDGGDELFGGYLHHSWVQSQARLRRLVPGPLRRAMQPLAAALPPGVRGRNFLVGLTGDETRGLLQFNLFFDAASRQRLLRPLGIGLDPQAPGALKLSLAPAGGTALQRATAIDFRTYLPDDILVKVDRASMLASLEVRAPWLEPRLIEFAFGRVPDRLRATAAARKILPRRLAARLLPPSLDLTRKQGFSLPLAAWFTGPWGDFVRDTLLSPSEPVFDRAAVERLLGHQARGYTNEHRLFALTMFELWRREYRVAVA